MERIEWDGLLPIFSLVLRHCSGVAIGGAATCTEGTPVRTTKDLRTRSRACLGRHVATGLLRCFIATRFGCSVSLQGRACGRCRDKRVRQKSSVTTENSLSRQALQCFLSRQRNPCRDRLLKDSCHNRVFLVATESAQPHVATRHGAGRVDVCATVGCAIARSVRSTAHNECTVHATNL